MKAFRSQHPYVLVLGTSTMLHGGLFSKTKNVHDLLLFPLPCKLPKFTMSLLLLSQGTKGTETPKHLRSGRLLGLGCLPQLLDLLVDIAHLRLDWLAWPRTFLCFHGALQL